MVLDNFAQKSFQAVKRGYDSDLSKKLGIFKHPAIMISYGEFRKIRGYILSAKLRSLYAQDKLNDVILAGMTYQDLEYVKQYDVELFKKIAEKVHSVSIDTLKQKPKITVGFFLSNSSSWCCGRIYHYFEDDPRFEPMVLVCGSHDGTDNFRKDTYYQTLTYFKENGYRTVGLWDPNISSTCWDDLVCPDIVFLLTPYSGTLPNSLNIFHIPLSTLLVYIPYAILSAKLDWWYDSPGPQLSWVYFCENSCIFNLIGQTALLGNYNVVISGHPKMDPLINPQKNINITDLWKFSHNLKPIDSVKRIIYTPHQSIGEGSNIIGVGGSSTFYQNYLYMYNYAKEHPDTTSWIIKPHPLLRSKSVEYGLFSSEDEYDAYLDKWDALPNARSIRFSGEYTDAFLTSDAMITDSGSFLSEYLAVNKPTIQLVRNEQEYNSWGKKVISVLYRVPGGDLPSIGLLIQNVILNGDDILSRKRDDFFKEYCKLEYPLFVNDSSEYIYDYVCDKLFK